MLQMLPYQQPGALSISVVGQVASCALGLRWLATRASQILSSASLAVTKTKDINSDGASHVTVLSLPPDEAQCCFMGMHKLAPTL